ncbi:MAG: hypothetical protein GF308_21285 [Candidatus Heimdallarchaeota archaeon]|nr:hypothetical protein [Candidatus Heimdallarchaeota archaeon]
MILPKFIAVQAYLESVGTAFADLRYVERLLIEMLKEKELTSKEGSELLEHKTDTARTIFNLFQHIGIMKSRKDEEVKEEYFSLTSIGRELLENKKESQSLIQPLTPFFLTWLPLKIFLKYLQESPGCDIEEIKTNLGNQIIRHTKEAADLLSIKNLRGGVQKPFNEVIIENVLATIGEFLGLSYAYKRQGPYYLTPLGKYVSNSIDLQNFHFKIEKSFDSMNLAILDFLEREPKKLVIISSANKEEKIKQFVDLLIENKKYSDLTLEYRNNNSFEAALTRDSVLWKSAHPLITLTYDQIKVLEFNSQIINVIG